MEFQIVNEISSFWDQLVVPIVMGVITIVYLSWLIGSELREKIMDSFINLLSNKKVILNKGIYIPKDQTKTSIFFKKLIEKLGLTNMTPLLSIFLFVLLMFGINQILSHLYQPNKP
ncbi:MAG: hypothetical protein K0S47_1608 [Herbinix sp.]|jgi:uncharacterized protein YggT (Ycf19 family)|nr:hypothetical protein [Herbinix sp.]